MSGGLLDHLNPEQATIAISASPSMEKSIGYKGLDWQWIVDQTNGGAQGNMSFNTGQILSSVMTDPSEMYIELPVTITASSGTYAATTQAAQFRPFALGPKAGSWHLVSSASATVNGVTVATAKRNLQVLNQFRAMCGQSKEVAEQEGPSVWFIPDTGDSHKFDFNAQTYLDLYSNNDVRDPVRVDATAVDRPLFNEGLRKRCQIVDMPVAVTDADGDARLTRLRRSHVMHVAASQAGATFNKWWAIIRLKDLLPAFETLKLGKGYQIDLQLNLNIVSAGAPSGPNSVALPYMLTSDITPAAAAYITNKNTIALSIGQGRLYYPVIQLRPEDEQAIMSVERSFPVRDHDTYELRDQAPGAQINWTLSSGIMNPRYLVIGLYYKDTWKTAECTEPGQTSFGAALGQIQLTVAGRSVFSNPINFSYSQFKQTIQGLFETEGDGLQTKGLISEADFNGGHRYYAFDLSRFTEQDKTAPVSIQLQGVLESPPGNAGARNVDIIAVVVTEKTMKSSYASGKFQLM